MLLNKKKKMIHWIPPSMKYWILSSTTSDESLYKYSISGNSSNTEMYQHTHRTSEYKYDYICDDISTTEMYQLTPYRYEYNCHYIISISQWTSIEYIPEPEKPPYEFIPFKWRYAKCMGEPYKGGKGYGKHGRGKHGPGKHGRGKNVRGNYSKRGNKKH
jgi:SNF2 family DNA or RNA helicase